MFERPLEVADAIAARRGNAYTTLITDVVTLNNLGSALTQRPSVTDQAIGHALRLIAHRLAENLSLDEGDLVAFTRAMVEDLD